MRRVVVLMSFLWWGAVASAQPVPGGSCSSCPELQAYWDALVAEGKLRGGAIDSSLPPDTPLRLITNNWFFIIPDLPQRFPDTPMMVTVRAVGGGGPAVTVRCADGGLRMRLEFEFFVEWYGQWERIFQITSVYERADAPVLRFDPRFPFEILRGAILSQNDTLTESSIGIFDITWVSSLISYWLSFGGYFDRDIPVPRAPMAGLNRTIHGDRAKETAGPSPSR